MKILIVDDHAIVRDGVRRLLASNADHIIREAANGLDALTLVRSFQPDLLVLDLNMPGLGGLELLRRVVEFSPARVLILSMLAQPLYVRRALEAGAHGYLSKNAPPDELLLAVRRISTGKRYIETEIAQALALDEASEIKTLSELSTRDIEILRLLSHGSSLSEIAAALGFSYKTAANNCAMIKSKLGVTRTADLVRLAIDSGIS